MDHFSSILYCFLANLTANLVDVEVEFDYVAELGDELTIQVLYFYIEVNNFFFSQTQKVLLIWESSFISIQK